MVDNKKEQERDELHRTIWSMANDFRGSVDGWDFKQYREIVAKEEMLRAEIEVNVI